MSDYKTMRVPEDAWEAAQSYRQEHGLTWGEYLRLPVDDDVATEQPDVDIDETRKAAKQAESNTEEIKRQLEKLQEARV